MNYIGNECVNLLKEVNKKLYLEDETIQNIIFVYCPPKVGSTTLVSSIRLSASDKFKVLHIHDETMLNVLTGINGITIKQIIQYNKHIGRNVWVFDIYRSPIERKMSEFFDKLSAYHFNNTEDKLKNYDIRRLITRFNNIFAYIANGDHYIEKYQVIREQTFNFEQGYILYNQYGINYVKLRLTDSHKWSNILTDLLGKRIHIVNDYEMEKSNLSNLYKKFKLEFKIPENYLDMIKNCPYLNYYYSPEEKNEYINSWRIKQCDSYQGYSVSDYEIYKNICIENKWCTNIQANHYLDEGCNCKDCSKKRKLVLVNIQTGNPIEHLGKIIHGEIVKDVKDVKEQIVVHKKIHVTSQQKLHQQIHQTHVKRPPNNKNKTNLIDSVFNNVYT